MYRSFVVQQLATCVAIWLCFDLIAWQYWYSTYSIFFLVTLTLVPVSGILGRGAPRPINLREWHFDKNSGEYFPIRIANHAGYIWDIIPYSDRARDAILRISGIGFLRVYMFICYAILVFSFFKGAIYINYDSDSYVVQENAWANRGFAYLFDLAAFFYGHGLMHWVEVELEQYYSGNTLPPVAPAGRDTVDQEKVYGLGGFGDLDELNIAARGDASRASSHLPIFDD